MWQRDVKTVQEMVEKTLTFVLEHNRFKVLGAGRTDAMVSANDYCFQLFMRQKIDMEQLVKDLNINIPFDIRVMGIKPIVGAFNIIQSAKEKEYMYLFTHGEKFHPFCAPFMAYIPGELDIPLMKEGAKLFEGEHNFRWFCARPGAHTNFIRSITSCELRENDLHTASFFPEKTYLLSVVGKGFLRYQIRFMMGTLIKLGNHEISLEDIKAALRAEVEEQLSHPAPSSGLVLNRLEYDMDKTPKD
jgi:tRNA pseudouridine38-40 synthase